MQPIEKDKRSKIKMNQPIFIGKSTLDLSKIIDIYKFNEWILMNIWYQNWVKITLTSSIGY